MPVVPSLTCKFCYHGNVDEDANKTTIDAYENGLEQYNAAAVTTVSGDVKDWVDASLAMLSPGSRILEIGSAHGRDALYMESKGFEVDRTDAAKSFVKYMHDQGHDARLLNVLTDDLGGPYDMVFANAVLLHFNVGQTKAVLKKIKNALEPRGLITFSVKIGEGSEWSNAKLKDARFYTYWQEQPLRELLESVGFAIKYFEQGQTGHNNSGWFHVIARKT
jgi:2-polyprenyl-3-methyl-5-hydroxy-6-metoxy-1,4-benzoquinol methylase